MSPQAAALPLALSFRDGANLEIPVSMLRIAPE
jgi:hypothetical protein